MKNSIRLRKLMLILLLPVAILLINIASLSPYLVEKIYSRGFYKVISQVLSLLAGWVPFSLIEFVIIIFVPIVIAILIKGVVKIVKSPSGRGGTILNYILNVLIFVSVLYFIFVITFDINYQRLPFGQIADMDVRPATVDELFNVCEGLAEHANNLRSRVKEDSNGIMKLSDSLTDTFKSASKGYMTAAGIYPELGGRYSRPKGVAFSRVLTIIGFQGIHSPITQEANINTEISDCMIPSTACHEMAHQRGFAREDEANYIAYLTCSKHPDADFQYSGELLALIYSMNALYDADRDKFMQIYKKYDSGIVRDLSADTKFWQRFKGPVENLSSTINDAYLKTNKQKDGVKSYGRMVDLLIAQYRKNGPEGL
jgi:hypothetical protein